MKKIILSLFFIASSFGVFAQDAVNYQMPPKAIADLLLAKPTPSVSIDSKAEWMLFSERNSYPSVEELAMPEYRIAGMRINPNNYSPSRQTFINSFSLKNVKTGKTVAVTDLPNPLICWQCKLEPK
jgi:hypothetical protein